MVAPASLAGVARVLVLGCDRLDADRIELASLNGRIRQLDEFLFVPQMLSRFRAGSKGCIVVERVVVELELPMRAVGKCGVRARVRIRAGRTIAIGPTRRADISVRVRPSTRIPRPTDAGCAQFVANRHPQLWR